MMMNATLKYDHYYAKGRLKEDKRKIFVNMLSFIHTITS